MSDLISRQAAKLKVARVIWEDGDSCYDFNDKCVDCLDDVPSAQPQLPEWAQKVEKYRKSAPSHIHNPLAWALYQTWKEYDR